MSFKSEQVQLQCLLLLFLLLPLLLLLLLLLHISYPLALPILSDPVTSHLFYFSFRSLAISFYSSNGTLAAPTYISRILKSVSLCF
jgi:hypothetical protein